MDAVEAAKSGHPGAPMGMAEMAQCPVILVADIDRGGVIAQVPGRRGDRRVPMVTLATAHPAKFPDAVERAIGHRPGLPPHMADLFDLPERLTRVENDVDALKSLILERRTA